VNEIDVSSRDDGAFEVEVREGSTVTRHEVTVPDDLAAAAGLAPTDRAAFVRDSFRFLLEREPASSILGRFSLDVISHYFPEYPAEMVRRWAERAPDSSSDEGERR
jgi:hypothetical protein